METNTRTQNGTLAVATLDTVRDAVKPPPKKRVLLRAAAQALFEENQAARDKAQKQINGIIERRRKFLVKHCRKIVPDDVCVSSYSVRNGAARYVEFRYTIPIEVVKPFQDEIDAAAMPAFRRVEEFERELRAAQVQKVDIDDAVDALLSDKTIRGKLVECGRKLLAGA